MRFSTIISALSIASFSTVVSAWKCELDDVRYNGQNATLIQAIDVSPFNSTMNVTISGTMKVTDACSFTIENFVFQPEMNETFWYGIRDETYNKGMISNDSVVPHNGETATYSFVDFPIARGWDDIDTLVLFSRSANVALAYAKLNLTEVWKIRNTTVPTSTDGSVPTSTSTATAIPNSSNSSSSSSSSRMQVGSGLNPIVALLSMVVVGFFLL